MPNAVKFGAFAAALVTGLLITASWPLMLEPGVSDSLKLSLHNVRGQPVPLSDLLGPVDLVCATGPYDSYAHPRFAGRLTKGEAALADGARVSHDPDAHGARNVFLVGLRDGAIVSRYGSSMFHNLPTREPHAGAADCAVGTGTLEFTSGPGTTALRLVPPRAVAHSALTP